MGTAALNMLPLDYVEFFIFVAALCLVALLSGRGERKSSDSYFLAGRRLPWYVVGGSYVAANVSTEHFIGLVGASVIMGAAPALTQWLTSLVELVVVFLFVPFLIRANITTVPEYLGARYGHGVRRAFALLTIFANITIFMAAVMYAGGLVVSAFFGWPLLACIIGTGLFAGGWAVYGGLNTVAWTGVFTAIVKIGGVTLLTVLALKAMSPTGGVIDGFLNVIHRNIAGSGAWQHAVAVSSHNLTHYGLYNRLSVIQPPDHPLVPWTGSLFTLFSVGVWYAVMNQFIVQRVLGARNVWHARMGMLMAGYAKLFLPLIVVLPGMILFARHPDFLLGNWTAAQHRADTGFVVLVQEFLPVGLRGMLLAVLISAVLSTVSSVVNATAAILTLDIYVPLIDPGASDHRKVRVGMWASMAAVVAGIAVAIYVSTLPEGVYQYMHTINAFVAPPFAAILWVGLLWKRFNGAGAMVAIVGGLGLGLTIKVVGDLFAMPSWYYPFANQAAVCLLVSLLLCLAGTLIHPAPTPGTQAVPVTFWNSIDTLKAGLGGKWYGYDSVWVWGGILLALTVLCMLIFSPVFFPVSGSF